MVIILICFKNINFISLKKAFPPSTVHSFGEDDQETSPDYGAAFINNILANYTLDGQKRGMLYFEVSRRICHIWCIVTAIKGPKIFKGHLDLFPWNMASYLFY